MGKGQAQDITGMRSGLVTAVEPTGERRNGNVIWRCRCDCGRELYAEAYKITRQRVKSCGCVRGQKRRKELAGQRFGRLTVVQRLDEKRGSNYVWLCRCDCGNEMKATTNALLSGNTKSCGCGRVDAVRQTVETHGTVADHVRLVDGTCVEKLEHKGLQRNNTSGCTGVQARGSKWIALITFKGKVHYLGIYSRKEDAVRARRQAEEQLFGTFLDWYYEQEKAECTAGSGTVPPP